MWAGAWAGAWARLTEAGNHFSHCAASEGGPGAKAEDLGRKKEQRDREAGSSQSSSH